MVTLDKSRHCLLRHVRRRICQSFLSLRPSRAPLRDLQSLHLFDLLISKHKAGFNNYARRAREKVAREIIVAILLKEQIRYIVNYYVK